MTDTTTKYIFVTGGVSSSLGKGIIAASLAKLLQAQGYRTTIQKLDPYINIDPGTLNPYEHGECYVTDDGAETDLDLGHYERFLNVPTSQANNVTTRIIRFWVFLMPPLWGSWNLELEKIKWAWLLQLL